MDTRRFCPPEDSFSYRTLVSPDARKETSERSKAHFYQTDVISQAQGSAYAECGRAKVLCAVYGPREIPRRSDFSMKGLLLCHFTRAPFSSSRRGRRSRAMGRRTDPEEQETGLALQEALASTVCLDLFPKSQIDVHVTVLEDDDDVDQTDVGGSGSAVALAVTCAGMAIASASIPMFDLIIGDSMVLAADGDACLPSTVTIGYLPNLEQIAMLIYNGNLALGKVFEEVKKIVHGCKELHLDVQSCLMRAIKK